MTAREAYRALTTGSLDEGCKARLDGWRTAARGAEVTICNVRTGEVLTGERKWSKTAGRWSKRVTFGA